MNQGIIVTRTTGTHPHVAEGAGTPSRLNSVSDRRPVSVEGGCITRKRGMPQLLEILAYGRVTERSTKSRVPSI